MKSKEFIQHFHAILEQPESLDRSQQYQTLITQLYEECAAITRQRLGGIEILFNNPRQSDTRIVRAYGEGQVKWNSVYHGLHQKLGRLPPEPFHRSGFYLAALLTNLNRLIEGERQLKLYDEVATSVDSMMLLAGVAGCPRYRQFKADAQRLRDEHAKKIKANETFCPAPKLRHRA